VTFQDRLEISTSEGVTVRLTIAGIGSRALAWVLDGLILFVALSIVGIVGINTVDADSLLGLGLLSLVALFLPMAYAIAFDVLNGGRTLGKMAAGTKVVRASGAPVGFGSAVVRALFVPVDFFLLGIGVIAMFATRRTQRIGDLAARTVVVRDRTTEVLDPGAPVTDLPAGPRWDVATVSNEEIRSFLARSASLPPGRRAELARDLRRRVEPRVGAVSGTYPDEVFLTRVVAEKLASEGG
jgi:uncharacterized RDD family membrane protein YckC